MTIKIPILPSKQTFVKRPNVSHELDLKAICVFVATGFFMGEDTYWKDQACLAPAHTHKIDDNGHLIKSEPWFQWYYAPRELTFEQALEEYIQLFTNIIKEQVGDQQVILPLSGGLDSRSQALILKDLDNPVRAFSYAFQDGYPEHTIAKQIAKYCNFSFDSFEIKKGYLWNCINDLADINGCYSEFTHPRQMAVLNVLENMKGLFSLGHWGDVLFDRGVPEGTQESAVLPLLFKKMVKPRGFELAQNVWEFWNLEGDFKSYLISRIEDDLAKIEIDNVSAKVRAYKTSQWAHRWTTTNLTVFEAANSITLPYYDDRMCQFICTIPEAYLADRRLQIAHIKQDKTLANITWQDQNPFNLNNYHYNITPYNLPYRVINKLKREVRGIFGKPYIQRNWELQFVGGENAKYVEQYLFSTDFNNWIPKALVKSTYNNFINGDAVASSHAVSMLLTLSLWHQQNLLNF
ncbi:asparagine synthase-related protein [Winogradskyella sp. R77965]|uniref:asparagine synthase-related protein n=1 Tax=Winogradskyella sp. R77965 TaxID=3093872 RepID=UPI0037DCB9F0